VADLTICVHLWGQKYGSEYVDRLDAGIRRNLRRPYRFVVITENPRHRNFRQTTWRIPPEDFPLLAIRGCFARLRLFDPAWQDEHGIKEGDRIVSVDLDMIVTGSLNGLFNRPEPFVILQGVNASNPCPMNGSVWMLRGGYRPDVWTDFSLDAAAEVPHFEFPDDQAWFAAKMPDAGAFTAADGVYAFKKPGWPRGDGLPANARVVAFPGWRDPARFVHLPWVQEHWGR
jgi:hypothetical protein